MPIYTTDTSKAINAVKTVRVGTNAVKAVYLTQSDPANSSNVIMTCLWPTDERIGIDLSSITQWSKTIQGNTPAEINNRYLATISRCLDIPYEIKKKYIDTGIVKINYTNGTVSRYLHFDSSNPMITTYTCEINPNYPNYYIAKYPALSDKDEDIGTVRYKDLYWEYKPDALLYSVVPIRWLQEYAKTSPCVFSRLDSLGQDPTTSATRDYYRVHPDYIERSRRDFVDRYVDYRTSDWGLNWDEGKIRTEGENHFDTMVKEGFLNKDSVNGLNSDGRKFNLKIYSCNRLIDMTSYDYSFAYWDYYLGRPKYDSKVYKTWTLPKYTSPRLSLYQESCFWGGQANMLHLPKPSVDGTRPRFILTSSSPAVYSLSSTMPFRLFYDGTVKDMLLEGGMYMQNANVQLGRPYKVEGLIGTPYLYCKDSSANASNYLNVSIVRPSDFEGVTTVDDGALYNFKNINYIITPKDNSERTIGNDAFGTGSEDTVIIVQGPVKIKAQDTFKGRIYLMHPDAECIPYYPGIGGSDNPVYPGDNGESAWASYGFYTGNRRIYSPTPKVTTNSSGSFTYSQYIQSDDGDYRIKIPPEVYDEIDSAYQKYFISTGERIPYGTADATGECRTAQMALHTAAFKTPAVWNDPTDKT